MRKKKVKGGNRLVAYYRYSGGSGQTEQSIEGQRRDCENYAKLHGLTIIHEYIDRHISGKTDDRAAFQQMMNDGDKGAFDMVICWKTDRFARNRYDSAVYKKRLRDNGIEILYAAESNVEGAEGIIIEGLMEALAEYYSAELAEKMRRGMRESALKGQAINRCRSLGLTTDENKKYVIDEKTAPTVRFIFEHYAAGESSTSIVEQLNAKGLRTSQGISAAEYEKLFLLPFAPLEDVLEKRRRYYQATQNDSGRWVLTPQGYLVSNDIITDLLIAQDSSHPLKRI